MNNDPIIICFDPEEDLSDTFHIMAKNLRTYKTPKKAIWKSE